MLNFLLRAARLAKQAKVALDVVSKHLDDRTEKSTPSSSGTSPATEPPPLKEKAVAPVSTSYQAMIDAGARDGRELLTREEAASILGEPVREAAITGQEEYLQCEYYAADGSATHLGISVSALMSWDYIETEVPNDETIDGLGKSAFRFGDTLYVKAANTVFWITRSGAATAEQGMEAARIAIAKL